MLPKKQLSGHRKREKKYINWNWYWISKGCYW